MSVDHQKIRFAVLERVVGSLIATHPDKAALVRKLEQVGLAADALCLNEPQMTDEAIDVAREAAAEWLELAKDELARTAAQKPHA